MPSGAFSLRSPAAIHRPLPYPCAISTTGLPRRVGGRIARRIAALSRRGYRRSSAAPARLREATDGTVWPSHPQPTTAPASQPLARSSNAINHMTITKEETAMNTSISEYASVGTDTGLPAPTSATTPTTMEGAATTEAAKSQRQVPARIGRAQRIAMPRRVSWRRSPSCLDSTVRPVRRCARPVGDCGANTGWDWSITWHGGSVAHGPAQRGMSGT